MREREGEREVRHVRMRVEEGRSVEGRRLVAVEELRREARLHRRRLHEWVHEGRRGQHPSVRRLEEKMRCSTHARPDPTRGS